MNGFWAVIVKRGNKLSTADMYARLDKITDLPRFTGKFAERVGYGDTEAALSGVGNAFCRVFSDNGVLDALRQTDPLGASLSGSGPSCFAVYRDETSARKAAGELIKAGFEPYTVPFVNRGVSIAE